MEEAGKTEIGKRNTEDGTSERPSPSHACFSTFHLPPSTFRPGQTLVEAVVAVGIFAAVAFVFLAFATSNAESLAGGRRLSVVQAYAQQGWEAARAVRDRGFNFLTVGTHGTTTSSGYWAFDGTEDVLEGQTGTVQRSVEVQAVSRSALPDGDIVSSGGVLDAATRKVIVWATSTPAFGPTVVFRIVGFLTRWLLTEIVHTSDADFLPGTPTSMHVVGAGDAAELALLATGAVVTQWVPGGGNSFTHTSVADFTAGTTSSLRIDASGFGVPGELLLETSTSSAWKLISTPSFTNHFNDLYLTSTVDGFAVGNGGTIVRWDGSVWQPFPSPTAVALEGIEMLSATDGFIVGFQGTILRWDGSAWNAMTSPTNNTLLDLSMISSSDGFAVGRQGEIIRWNGTSWSVVSSPSIHDLNGVSMISSSDGFAVGFQGDIIRWNGTSWSTVTSPVTTELFAVDMLSATDGWAVGQNGVILRWDGSSWSSFTSPTGDNLQSVFMISSSLGYAAGGNGTIIKWDGTSWAVDPHGLTVHQVNGVFFIGADNGWTVGNNGTRLRWGPVYLSPGTLYSSVFDSGKTTTTWDFLSWNETLPVPGATEVTVAARSGNTATPGPSWSAFSSEFTAASGTSIGIPQGRYFQYRVTLTTTDAGQTPRFTDITVSYDNPFGSGVNGVRMLSETDGWAVAGAGNIARYDGTAWAAQNSPTTNDLNGISMTTSTDGWAVGSAGTIVRWDGASWSLASSPTSRQLNGVDMLSATDGFAVGNRAGNAGTILRWDGTSWSTIAITLTQDLNDVDMVSASDGWAVGGAGTILRWNGTSWSPAASPTGSGLNGVSMLGPNAGFAVGAGGAIIQWNGASWVTTSSPVSVALEDVHYRSTTTAYAVGANGAILKFDGNQWTLDANVTANTIKDVHLVDDTEGWSVGANGFFLRLKPAAGFPSTGNFLSTVLDSGAASTTWAEVSWDGTAPTSTAISVATRTGETAAPDITWSSFSTELTDANGSSILSPSGRFLQYRVTLTTGDPTTSSILHAITIGY